MEVVKNVVFSKSGGNASKKSMTCRLVIPVAGIDELGVTIDDKAVKMTIEDGKIVIEKAKKEE